MRVIRGYRHDDKLVVDGRCYPLRDLVDAAFRECVAAGGSVFDLPPFFRSGSIYADAIHRLAAKNAIAPTAPPDDMDCADVPLFNGWSWAVRKPMWPELFIAT